MREIGETVVYGQNGVMTVVDIKEQTVLGEMKMYYVLHAPGSGEDSLTFVPCDNEKLVEMMQSLITKEELDRMIDALRDEPDTGWPEDNRSRSNEFKRIVDSGDRLEMLRMIRTIKKYGEKRAEEGKKSYLSDENLMRKAERRLYSEFAEVLGIDYSEVEGYIDGRLKI